MAITTKAKATSKELAKTLAKAPKVITQAESDEYVRVQSLATTNEKLRKKQSEIIKDKFKAGATAPTGSPFMLEYNTPDAPKYSWKDLHYQLCLQVCSGDAMRAAGLHEAADANNPREPQPKLNVIANPGFISKEKQ